MSAQIEVQKLWHQLGLEPSGTTVPQINSFVRLDDGISCVSEQHAWVQALVKSHCGDWQFILWHKWHLSSQIFAKLDAFQNFVSKLLYEVNRAVWALCGHQGFGCEVDRARMEQREQWVWRILTLPSCFCLTSAWQNHLSRFCKVRPGWDQQHPAISEPQEQMRSSM